jgi:hypothetical protein
MRQPFDFRQERGGENCYDSSLAKAKMSTSNPNDEAVQLSGDVDAWDRGIVSKRAHSTPDPDAEPPGPNPNPDDVPPPAHAPVQEPTVPEPPIKA